MDRRGPGEELTVARRSTSAATRLARLQEQLAEVRRARAGDQGAVVAYADDEEEALKQYVARRERAGAELVVVVRSLAARPQGEPPPWA
jgi:hypothetical protein